MSTFRIEDPELNFGNLSRAMMYGPADVEIKIVGWCGTIMFTNIKRVPVEYVGSPQWPKILRDIRLQLVEDMLKKNNGPDKFTIAQRR